MLLHTYSDVYSLWMTGIQMVIEGSVLTYTGKGGFKYVRKNRIGHVELTTCNTSHPTVGLEGSSTGCLCSV